MQRAATPVAAAKARKNAPSSSTVLPIAVPPKPARAGRQHKYIQELIKRAAQERGYYAVVEESVLGGTGRVDVSLSKADRRIACEISVTTGNEWELGNVEKCIAAGYDQVLVVATDDREVQALAKFIWAHLDESQRDRVLYLTPSAVISYLDESQGGPAADETVRGYTVRVSRRQVDFDEASERRRTVAEVLARSIRRTDSVD